MVAEPIPITSWKELRNPNCTLCPIHEEGAKYVCMVGDGPERVDYMIIGEAPGQHEDEVSHKPFTGPAGDLLNKLLKDAGLKRSMFVVSNSVMCRPLNNRDPETKEIKTCWTNYGQHLLSMVQPKIVILMGRFALQAVMGRKQGITEARGHEFVKDGITFLPTFHTSYALRQPGIKRWIAEDLAYFRRIAGLDDTRAETKPELVSNWFRLREVVDQLMQAETVAVDLETAGLDPFNPKRKIWCMSLSDREGHGYVVPIEHPIFSIAQPNISGNDVWTLLRPLIESKKTRIVGHNYKFDMKWMMTRGIKPNVTFDTLQAAHLLDENRKHNLKSLGQSYLGVRYWGSGKQFEGEEPPKFGDDEILYAAKDADYDRQLYFRQREELLADHRLARVFQYIVMPSLRALAQMEYHGIPVDLPKLRTRITEAKVKVQDAEEELEHLIGKKINWNSPRQVAQVLFTDLELPILSVTKTGQASTGKPVLAELKEQESPVIKALLEYRRWGKLLSTYLLPWSKLATEAHPYLHTIYHVEGTVTGRLSSGDRRLKAPNLQNIPRDGFVKGCIGGIPGWFIVEADLSQIEMRIAAVLSKDPMLHRSFREKIDVHRLTSSRLLGKAIDAITDEERFLAKAVNFGFIYGMGSAKFQTYAKTTYDLTISYEDSLAFRETYFQLYRALTPWHEHQRVMVRKYGYVRSPLGRIRRLPDIESSNWEVAAEAERQAINSPVQGTASDFILLALAILTDELIHEVTKQFEKLRQDEIRVIATVHDSLVFMIKEDKIDKWMPIIQNVMENLPLKRLFDWTPTVPIEVEIKQYRWWGEKVA